MTNLEVAQAAKLRPIGDVAAEFGLGIDDFESLGRYKGKLTMEGITRLTRCSTPGKLVLVTAITPTLKGEGKTTVTVGLTQGLNRLGLRAVSATREPALGPIFGSKGGACGGGYSQVLPMEDINLLFTGDFPAISATHNLLSAMLDAHLHHGNELGIDPRVDRWPRAVDMNDRALRSILVGLGGHSNGPVRENGFVITPASEIMAILCLSRSLPELRERLGLIVVGVNTANEPVTARDLKANGAMTALMRDAIRPNIVQTLEGGLAFVHGGPFANIAHGCSSILATECALGLSEFVVTEGGFGSDLGGEKFLNLVCSHLGRGPSAIVLVASIRALKHHGGGTLSEGFPNLVRHVQHLRAYGPPIVVAINRFSDDTDSEVSELIELCQANGIEAALCNPFSTGGAGCEELGARVAALAATPSSFCPLYGREDSVLQKLQSIVSKAYGGANVVLEGSAVKDLAWIEKHGFGSLPVCIAKTQYSLSDDPKLLNAPTGFDINIHSLHVSAGAGFIVAVAGDIMLMPGLGKHPAAHSIDVGDDGQIVGMF